MSIFVKDKDGNRVKVAGPGMPGPAGKSAYQYAAEGGFSGTEEQFAALLGRASNPNLLDNWYFIDPINQRGQTEYFVAGYTIDRWKALGNSVTLSIGDGYIHLVAASSNTNDLGVFSHQTTLQEIGIKPGDTVTLSFLQTVVSSQSNCIDVQIANDTKADYTQTQSFSVSTGETNLFSFAKTIPETWDKTDIIRFCTFQRGLLDLKIYAAKLELGPVQTLARQDADGNWVLNDPPPDKAEELLKCQRYYQIFATQSMRPAKAEDFRPPMRTNPALGTITIGGVTYYTADANL